VSERLSSEALADLLDVATRAEMAHFQQEEFADFSAAVMPDGRLSPAIVASLVREVRESRKQVRALTEAFRGEAPATFEAVADALGYCIDSPHGMAMAKHARQMETRARETEENVRALTADNAALLGAARSALQRMLAQDWSAARETLLEAAEKPHPGAATLAEMEGLRTKTAVAMGVGGGAGSLFVHGDHASIKAAQGIVLERDTLRARVAELEAAYECRKTEVALRTVLIKVAGETPKAWDEWETGEGEPLGPELATVLNTPEED